MPSIDSSIDEINKESKVSKSFNTEVEKGVFNLVDTGKSANKYSGVTSGLDTTMNSTHNSCIAGHKS